jgi:ABC-2 type transport system ATP-binding protein
MGMPPVSPSSVVRTEALTCVFGENVAVDHLDLTIEQGAIFGLLGPNGAGKSTTIKMLTTLLPPTSGRAFVAGYDVVREPADVRRHIGYVPQLVSADGALTGRENLVLSAKLYDVPRRERASRIDDALHLMGLLDAADALVKTYSGGMVRRLELAQALLHRPAVLFLDEPTIGLDPVARRTIWDRLRESRRNLATTVLITTHDMEEAGELCDRLAIMHAGRLAAIGSPEELKRDAGPDATLDDVFVHYAGGTIAEGGSYRDVVRVRRNARRLG